MARWLYFCLFGLVFLGVTPARASIGLCLVTKAEPSQLPSFEKLVRSEVARHPSHQITKQHCESHLTVELFVFQGTTFLTVQLDSQVPERRPIPDPKEVASELSAAMTLVLGNDPVVLSADPARFGAMERATHSVLVRGQNTYQLELFERVARTDRNLAMAPGLGFSFQRGADQWAVFARGSVASSPFGVAGTDHSLALSAGADAGALFETGRRSATSPYLGAGLGLMLLRFEGRLDEADRDRTQTVTDLGATLNLRAGLHLLRALDVSVDLFTMLHLPLFVTKEVDHPLFGDGVYTPMLEAGVGIGF